MTLAMLNSKAVSPRGRPIDLSSAPNAAAAAAAANAGNGRAQELGTLGDSTSANGLVFGARQAAFTNVSWVAMANALAGSPFDINRTAAIGGQLVEQIAARVESDVIAYSPKACTVLAGINNLRFGAVTPYTTAALIFAQLLAIYQKLSGAGIYVFALTIPPCTESGLDPYKIAQLNNLMRKWWRGRSDGEFVDTWAGLVNPTTSPPAAVSGALVDGIHFGPKGAQIVATLLSPRFTAQGLAPYSLVSSVTDNYETTTLSNNLISKGLMTGTAGVLTNSNTGVAPDGWYCGNASSIASVVWSTPARSDGIGNDLKCVATSMGANSSAGAVFYDASKPLMVGGGSFALEGEITIESATNGLGVDLAAVLTADSGNTYLFQLGTPIDASANSLAAGGPYRFRSGSVLVPANETFTTTFPLTTTFRCVAGPAGSAAITARLGRVAFRKAA